MGAARRAARARTVAALIALTRPSGGLRPLALAGAWALAFAWPLWGALPAAAAATLATAFVVRWGTGGAVVRRVDAPAAGALAAVAFVLLGVAFGGAPPDAVRADTARCAARHGACGHGGRGARHRPCAGHADDDTGPAGQRARARSGARHARPPLLPRARPARVPGRVAPPLPRRPRALRRVRALASGVRHDAVEPPGGASAPTAAPSSCSLVARDRAACGVLVQRFAVRWELRRSRATAVTARRLGRPGLR